MLRRLLFFSATVFLAILSTYDARAAFPSARFLNICGDRNAYNESEGREGPGVLLLHGNSNSSRTFEKQFDSAFGRKYRLVAFDFPGHGRSMNARHPMRIYTPAGFADVLLRVARVLKMEDAVFVGWSMGGHIAMEALPRLSRARGLVVIGSPPADYSFPPKSFQMNPLLKLIYKRDFSNADVLAYASLLFHPRAKRYPAACLADIRRSDPKMRLYMGQAMMRFKYINEAEAVKRMLMPFAFFVGEHERIVNIPYMRGLKMPTLWRGALQVFTRSGHAVHWEEPELFNRTLQAFIEDVSGCIAIRGGSCASRI